MVLDNVTQSSFGLNVIIEWKILDCVQPSSDGDNILNNEKINMNKDNCLSFITPVLGFLQNAMTSKSGLQDSRFDTIFMGGTTLTEDDQERLGRFSADKFYNIVYALHNPTQPAYPGLCVVFTDGESRSLILKNGKLWKRDRHSLAIIIFSEAGLNVKISNKGRMVIRESRQTYHEVGFQLAEEAVATGSVAHPVRTTVIGDVGGLIAVMDTETLIRICGN